ncbi:hypothetical protein [Mediterraneibacter gnavus]|uniref:hypothetical protein n=1 Tax=Mediterraneibacter gnavus TaxID=33038 RepID=UPI00232CA970|nr:hypothetical protein [Mediterraneibacter gnavus]MDB8681919.1 hypothetical protein [Mediterraneibacter gnavus]MDB8692980.1 hypothetical protein [Mediterraneibacter gnavus]
MEDPRIISALFIFLKMAYYNVLINTFIIMEICMRKFMRQCMIDLLYAHVIRNTDSVIAENTVTRLKWQELNL